MVTSTPSPTAGSAPVLWHALGTFGLALPITPPKVGALAYDNTPDGVHDWVTGATSNFSGEQYEAHVSNRWSTAPLTCAYDLSRPSSGNVRYDWARWSAVDATVPPSYAPTLMTMSFEWSPTQSEPCSAYVVTASDVTDGSTVTGNLRAGSCSHAVSSETTSWVCPPTVASRYDTLCVVAGSPETRSIAESYACPAGIRPTRLPDASTRSIAPPRSGTARSPPRSRSKIHDAGTSAECRTMSSRSPVRVGDSTRSVPGCTPGNRSDDAVATPATGNAPSSRYDSVCVPSSPTLARARSSERVAKETLSALAFSCHRPSAVCRSPVSIGCQVPDASRQLTGVWEYVRVYDP